MDNVDFGSGDPEKRKKEVESGKSFFRLKGIPKEVQCHSYFQGRLTSAASLPEDLSTWFAYGYPGLYLLFPEEELDQAFVETPFGIQFRDPTNFSVQLSSESVKTLLNYELPESLKRKFSPPEITPEARQKLTRCSQLLYRAVCMLLMHKDHVEDGFCDPLFLSLKDLTTFLTEESDLYRYVKSLPFEGKTFEELYISLLKGEHKNHLFLLSLADSFLN